MLTLYQIVNIRCCLLGHTRQDGFYHLGAASGNHGRVCHVELQTRHLLIPDKPLHRLAVLSHVVRVVTQDCPQPHERRILRP